MRFIPGPDFPTGGIIVEPRVSILKSYETGRGSFRVRARWEIEELGRGGYQIIVTEIPYQVQKSRLIEKIADLIYQKKLPILADVRDESSDIIRVVIEPKNRAVDPNMLMESLFKLTDLESRFPLNMNVLEGGKLPRVMPLSDVLMCFLKHRQDVLQRRSKYRLAKIDHRLEILEGYLAAYLNLDEVIRIIRFEDDVKKTLMATFKLTETQAEAILNMRLRSLRKLEEFEIKTEFSALEAEKAELLKLLDSDELRWANISSAIKELKKKFGLKTAIGKRRSDFADAPESMVIPLEAMIEKEPITIICSHKGWIRALKGHVAIDDKIKYKEGDKAKFAFPASTTDKVLVFASNGRFYTLGCDKLPGGRGHGEPIRLMVDLPNDVQIISMFTYRAGSKLLIASARGRGFIAQADNVIASTKGGKAIFNIEKGKNEPVKCFEIDETHDHVAVSGTGRKMLIFAMDQMPEMNKGRGAILQKYLDATMGDIITFKADEGISWSMKGGKTRTQTDLTDWIGKRGNVGRMAPHGFPLNNKFTK
jgi:topoisomerase-4 subunit A